MSKYDMVHLEYQLYIEKFVKSAITNMYLHEIIKQNLIAVEKQAVAKATHKKLNERITQKRGVVTIGQIRAKIQKCNNEEVVKVQIASDYTIATENCKLQVTINTKKKLWKDMFKKTKVIVCKKLQINQYNFYKIIYRSIKNR